MAFDKAVSALNIAWEQEKFSAGSVAFFTLEGGRETFHVGTTGASSAGKNLPVDDDTVYDLASLTKPLATVPVALTLIDRKLLSLDTTVRVIMGNHLSLVPWDMITIVDLLRHSAGFVPWAPLYQSVPEHTDPAVAYLETLTTSPKLLSHKPGTTREYSDLGYILLGLLLAHVAKAPLNQLFAEIVGPLAPGLHFNSQHSPLQADAAHYATTKQIDGDTLFKGQVHDDNARALWGVAGHAGLFGTLGDTVDLLEIMMRTFYGEDSRLPVSLTRDAMRVATNKDGTRWSLGFDTPTGESTTAGANAPIDCIGHLGFTGTSFWMAPGQRAGSVLLTNRVLKTTSKQDINSLRCTVHGQLW